MVSSPSVLGSSSAPHTPRQAGRRSSRASEPSIISPLSKDIGSDSWGSFSHSPESGLRCTTAPASSDPKKITRRRRAASHDWATCPFPPSKNHSSPLPAPSQGGGNESSCPRYLRSQSNREQGSKLPLRSALRKNMSSADLQEVSCNAKSVSFYGTVTVRTFHQKQLQTPGMIVPHLNAGTP